ncbi:18572_t:CDS:2 [Acaulospora morrowiae]|uniref:18572_t:CDS:1 n=1 Tax=Acaulospora morrowiae TaxID=94023 RepID=A0A9N8VW55_9GLOM|nr:18572_t:CDS:2 [Acaulospora morrowiae]
MSTGMSENGTLSNVWDTKLQQFHGGQDWNHLDNFIEDFSVTTNALGTPKAALEASREAVSNFQSSQSSNQEPAKTSLAQFLWPDDYLKHKDRLLLGNGASELIDLAIRSAPSGPWKPGPWDTQYKEYQRSAEANNRTALPSKDTNRATLLCIVNPCNPTGDYFTVEELKRWIIDNVEDGGVVLVDESMQPWQLSEFRSDSLISQHEFLASIYRESNVSVYVIHSWTKIWSCAGLRVGSVVCPTAQHCDALKRIQVPWSVNGPALAFLDTVVKDHEYMERTWEVTTRWRAELIDRLMSLSKAIVDSHNDERLAWKFHGKKFLSWVWIDMKTIEIAEEAVAKAKAAGVPVRSGNPGYDRPTFVRVAVREPSKVDFLIQAWKTLGIR